MTTFAKSMHNQIKDIYLNRLQNLFLILLAKTITIYQLFQRLILCYKFSCEFWCRKADRQLLL